MEGEGGELGKVGDRGGTFGGGRCDSGELVQVLLGLGDERLGRIHGCRGSRGDRECVEAGGRAVCELAEREEGGGSGKGRKRGLVRRVGTLSSCLILVGNS